MNGWGYALMAVGMVLFWGLLVLAVVALVRYLRGQDHPTASPPVAEQVLAERFAHGDIDEPEYRQRLGVLHASARSGSS